MSRYHITKRFSGGGLIGLTHLDYGDQLWARCKTRKSFTCAISGKKHESGEMAFRPIGNTMNRMDRIAEGELK